MSDAQPGERTGGYQSTSQTLLSQLRHNFPEGWKRLDHLYRPLIIYWCARRGVGRPHAEDICQEVFRVVFEKIATFRRDRPNDTFRGWLHSITKHLILKHFRDAAHEPGGQGGSDAGRRLQEVPDPALDDEDDPEAERAALLHRALELIRQEFSARDWQVFTLAVVESRTAPDIAKQLQLSAAAVRKAKSRMLRRLNDVLGEL
jgi:RNA polymerase sigma-70 factor (ECF subfamily)